MGTRTPWHSRPVLVPAEPPQCYPALLSGEPPTSRLGEPLYWGASLRNPCHGVWGDTRPCTPGFLRFTVTLSQPVKQKVYLDDRNTVQDRSCRHRQQGPPQLGPSWGPRTSQPPWEVRAISASQPFHQPALKLSLQRPLPQPLFSFPGKVSPGLQPLPGFSRYTLRYSPSGRLPSPNADYPSHTPLSAFTHHSKNSPRSCRHRQQGPPQLGPAWGPRACQPTPLGGSEPSLPPSHLSSLLPACFQHSAFSDPSHSLCSVSRAPESPDLPPPPGLSCYKLRYVPLGRLPSPDADHPSHTPLSAFTHPSKNSPSSSHLSPLRDRTERGHFSQ
ncbi:uncharacterized protein LOC135983052 [Chrysemys picta bellii]|uniref:uncharacterized protein LOC135983052 n=1 Tax=Chrysemys picta bellii TaxID=8478 RepID=UPI0032B2BECE